MLSLKPLFTVNRVTVFGDNADPDQFYCLPEQIRLATDSSGEPSFTLLKYMRDITDNPAFSEGQQLGGGFLIFSVNLSLDDDTRAQILRQASRYANDVPRLATAPFREGTVRVVGLDASATPVEGHVRFVENVYGTTTPSLFGDLQATFSLTLSQEGVVLLEKAFEQGGQPIGVVYEVKFLGLRPAFDVTVKADYKRIYDEFSVGIAAQYMMFRAEIEAGFQKLIQNKAIEVTVNSYTDDADARAQRDQALQFFKEDLLRDFFTQSLPLPASQSQDILAGLLPSLGLSQTPGRPVSQVTSGAPPVPGPATPKARRPGGATLPPPPGNSAIRSGVASILAGGNRNPSRGVASAIASALAAGPRPAGSPGAPATRPGSGPAPSGSRSGPASPATPRPASTPRPPSPTPAAAPAGGGTNANNMCIGFHLRYMHQDELKTFEMSWKEASAVEQTHSPNGTFGLLMRGLDRKKHFIDVNLDDDFFQRLKVMVDCPTPFAAIGLNEVKVHLEYGDRGDGQPKYVNDLELKPDAQGRVTPQEFTCSLDQKRTLSYRYRIDFYFDPNANIRGQKLHYTTDVLTGQDRTLSVDPETYVGFLKVEAAAGQINFDEIPRAQVKIGYDDDTNNFHVQDTFMLSKEKPSFQWMVRLNDPALNQYWYEVTYFLKDDQTIVAPRRAAINQSISINEPWQDRLRLLVDGLLSKSLSRLVVEIEYEDADAGYRYSSVREIAGEADKPYSVKIPLMDKNKQTYRYQVTAVGTDNSVRRGQMVEAKDAYLLAIAPPA